MKRILCSAIWYDDGKSHVHQPKNITSGFVVCGRRHHNCIATLHSLGVSKSDTLMMKETQGFLTEDDYFLNRKDAFDLAVENWQIDKPLSYEDKTELFSEDLW